ncbi:MAG: hypothetical protein D6785_09795 [Planctomycetota bacterium]|nr:MAG: hypothetical protein D6785_09795 [Planctomycetota bacterium]
MMFHKIWSCQARLSKKKILASFFLVFFFFLSLSCSSTPDEKQDDQKRIKNILSSQLSSYPTKKAFKKGNPANTKKENQILCKINGKAIPLQEYKDYLYKYLGEDYLENFIIDRLVSQKADQMGIKVSSQEIETFVGKRLGKLIAQAGGRQALVERLKSRGLTLKNLMDNMRKSAPLMVKLEKILLQRRLKKDFLYKAYLQKFGPKIKVQHIWYPYESLYALAAEREAKKLGEKILKKIREKKITFFQAVKLYSEANSARKNGSLGWIHRDKLKSPSLVQALDNLSVGEISPLVKTDYGYHILYLKDRKGKYCNLYHIFISSDYKRRLKNKDMEKWKAKAFQDIRKLYDSIQKGETSFPELFISKKEDPYIREEISFRRYASDLEPALEKEAFALKENEISPPLRSAKGVHLFRLVKKEPPLRPFDQKCLQELREIVKYQEIEDKEIIGFKENLRQTSKIQIFINRKKQ